MKFTTKEKIFYYFINIIVILTLISSIPSFEEIKESNRQPTNPLWCQNHKVFHPICEYKPIQ